MTKYTIERVWADNCEDFLKICGGQFALKEGADKVIYTWLVEPFNWFLNN